tara:strand:+ start:17348 stop:17824 length:477 start_codon:yes stop_codon:yes gene_type:complete
MSKRIPKQLKKSILRNLLQAGPLSAAQVSERVNGDETVPSVYQKNPRQMAFVLKRLVREDDRLKLVELGRNGKLPSGQDRFRMAFAVDEQLSEDEIDEEEEEAPKMKQITVNLPPICVEYLRVLKDTENLSPGRVFEQFINTDIEANGAPVDPNGEKQ